MASGSITTDERAQPHKPLLQFLGGHRAHLEKGWHMFTGLVPFRAKAGPGAPMELLLPGTMRGSRATSAVAVEGTSAAQFKAGLAELSKLAQLIDFCWHSRAHDLYNSAALRTESWL